MGPVPELHGGAACSHPRQLRASCWALGPAEESVCSWVSGCRQAPALGLGNRGPAPLHLPAANPQTNAAPPSVQPEPPSPSHQPLKSKWLWPKIRSLITAGLENLRARRGVAGLPPAASARPGPALSTRAHWGGQSWALGVLAPGCWALGFFWGSPTTSRARCQTWG